MHCIGLFHVSEVAISQVIILAFFFFFFFTFPIASSGFSAKSHVPLTTLRCNACSGLMICVLTRVPTILAGLQDFSGGGLPAHTTAG